MLTSFKKFKMHTTSFLTKIKEKFMTNMVKKLQKAKDLKVAVVTFSVRCLEVEDLGVPLRRSRSNPLQNKSK